MDIGFVLAQLIRRGGIQIHADLPSPNGEYFVQIVLMRSGKDYVANGYYPTVNEGLQDCLYKLKAMKTPKNMRLQ